MIGTTVSHYRILEKLGAGGMGEVYLAQDTELGRKVALKFLPGHFAQDEEARVRFKREAQALAALNHPHIVTVFEVGEHDGRPYLSMEYVDGQSLRQMIASGDIGIEKIINLATQICEALSAAHDEKIVHRDIKSDNIIVSAKGQVKVMDFGLATWRGVVKVTRESTTVGTMAYLSPEQAQGGEVDHRSDLFSLGVVLYELITAHLPFAGEHEAAVIYSIIHEPAPPLERYRSGLLPGLQPIVDKLLDKDPETRYQSAAGVAADLKRLKKASDPAGRAYTGAVSAPAPASPTPRASRSRKGLFITTTILVAAVVTVLVLRPWRVMIQPTDQAEAVENRLAVLYFDNLDDPADPEKLGEITASLLISDLSASPYLQVVSNQRLYDILKFLGYEGTRTVDHEVASQVARKANARWMLTGSILRTQPNLVVTAQLIDVATGSVTASPRISGEPGEDVFVLVDRLSSSIREQLELTPRASVEDDQNIASLTTSSTDAYRHYLQGWAYNYQHKYREAEDEFRKAIDLDSGFVQAYYGLSFVAISDEPLIRRKIIARAMQQIDKLGDGEALILRARSASLNDSSEAAIAIWERLIAKYPDEKEAYFRLADAYRAHPRHDYAKSTDLFSKVIEIDPLFKDAYNNLAYDYWNLGEFDKSIWAINKYIDIAPNEPNPYDTRGDLYARNGQLDLAIASYKNALQIDLDFASSRKNLAYCYLWKQEFDRADSLFQKEASHKDRDRRAWARRYRVDVPLFRGQLMEALRRANTSAEVDLIEYGSEIRHQISGQAARSSVFGILAELYNESRWYDSVRSVVTFYARAAALDTALAWPKALDVDRQWMYLALDVGDRARADSIYRKLLPQIDTTSHDGLSDYLSLRASMEFKQGNYAAAVPFLERFLKDHHNPWTQIRLGRALLSAGSIGRAVEVLEKAERTKDASAIRFGADAALVHFWLGQAYEASAWTDKAVEQYETLLDIWKDADPEIIFLDQARERLARLKGEAG